MKAVRLGDLRELLQGAPFAAWWAEYSQAIAALVEVRSRYEDLHAQAELMELRAELAQRSAIDTFSAAGEAEDAAGTAGAEAHANENRALELVGSYEDQRFRTSDLWYRLGGAERTLEERREAAAAAARAAESARGKAQAALEQAERQHQVLRDEYGVEDRKRAGLWDEVEAAWDRSFERSLLAAEHGQRSRRIRRDAERLFKEAEERRARARQLEADATAARFEHAATAQRQFDLLARAAAQFGCASGHRWLYFRRADDKRAAWAIALSDDPDGANIEVKALGIYSVSRQKGVAFLEPAREGLPLTVEEGDRRFEEYFLGPRRGAHEDGPAPAADPAKP